MSTTKAFRGFTPCSYEIGGAYNNEAVTDMIVLGHQQDKLVHLVIVFLLVIQ